MNKQEKGRSLILQSALTLGLMILPLLITQSYAGPKIMDPFESNQFTHTDVPPDISGDPCQVTSQHYLNKDLPNDEIVKLFEKIAKGGDVREPYGWPGSTIKAGVPCPCSRIPHRKWRKK